MRGCSSRLLGTCGVSVWYDFSSSSEWWRRELRQLETGGIGFTIAGFVNSKRCQKAYNWIAEHKEIVFQSPVKRNRNSGNRFFFIVFKNKE